VIVPEEIEERSVKSTHNGAHPEKTSAVSSAVGIAFTVTVTEEFAVQPFASVATTVYVAVVEGVIVCVCPGNAIGNQAKLYAGVPPFAVAFN